MTMQKVKFWRPIWNKTVSGYPCRFLAGDTKTPDTTAGAAYRKLAALKPSPVKKLI